MLTEKEVEERAISPEAALDVSIQHHEENLELSEEEVRAAFSEAPNGILDGSLCGLCQCQSNRNACSRCILYHNDQNCGLSSSQYDKMLVTLKRWHNGHGSFSDYRVEQFKMVELLKRLKAENYGKDKCEKNFCVKSTGGTIAKVGLSANFVNLFLDKNVGITSWYPETAKELGRELIRVADNIDDLKCNSEDLREFEVLGRGCYSDGLKISRDGPDAKVVLGGNSGKNDLWFDMDGLRKLHQKLGRLIATAEKDKK